MDLLQILQLIGSLFLLANKIQLLREKSIGWIYGIMGVLFLLSFTISNHLWISLIYNCSYVVLLGYGFYLTTDHSKNLTSRRRRRLQISFITLTVCACVYLWTKIGSANYGNEQLAQTLCGLAGTLCMAFDKPLSKMCAWGLYIVSHFCTIFYIGELYQSKHDGMIIIIFQVISLGFAVAGLVREKKKHRRQKQMVFSEDAAGL